MDAIRLKNYRCFSDTGQIKLQPVNILLGKNSVGKSSFLKFFPLLKQSRVKHPNGIFLWYADDVDFKDFKNTVKNGEGNIEIEFHFQRKFDDALTSSKSKKIQNVGITVILTLSGHPKDENLDYLSNLKISFEDISIELSFNPMDDKKFYHPLKGIKINENPIEVPVGIIPQLSDDGFIPRLLFQHDEEDNTAYLPFPNIEYEYDLHELLNNMESMLKFPPRSTYRWRYYRSSGELADTYKSLPKKQVKQFKTVERFIENVYLTQLNNIIEDINTYIDDLARNIFYIQPVRANAKRYYRFQNLAVDEIDSHGDNLPMYLNSLSKGAMDSLNEWIEPFFKFRLQVRPKEGHIQINITETETDQNKTPMMRNLVDVGFGYSQLLPIIVQIWNALRNDNIKNTALRKKLNNPKIIVIEQPELHLHPRMMSFFAKMLFSLIKDGKKNVRFIIETHSETLIEALGRYIIQDNNNHTDTKSIDPEAFQILIFNKQQGDTGTSISATRYNNNGLIERWPYGFFSGRN